MLCHPSSLQALGGVAIAGRIHPAALQRQRRRVEQLLQRDNLIQAVKAIRRLRPEEQTAEQVRPFLVPRVLLSWRLLLLHSHRWNEHVFLLLLRLQSSAAVHTRLIRRDKHKRLFGSCGEDSGPEGGRSNWGSPSTRDKTRDTRAEPEEQAQDLAFLEALHLQQQEQQAPTALQTLEALHEKRTIRDVEQPQTPPSIEAVQQQVTDC